MSRHVRLARLAAVAYSASLLECTFREAAPPRCPELADTDPWAAGDVTGDARGDLLRCAHVSSASGYEVFVLQYVSETRPGVLQGVSALAYLPSGEGDDRPRVALGHGALGIGPSCGPSHVPALTDGFGGPLAARGYAVIAPDFAGNGVDNGMSSYLVGKAEASAMVDGLAALANMHDARFDTASIGRDAFVVGHSQGGHAALFTHQLFASSSVSLRLRGSVALAPGLGSARHWASFVAEPARPVGLMETFALSSFYARMLYAGAPDAATWLSVAAREKVPAMLHDECLSTLATTLAAAFPTLADLYTPAFLAAARACAFDGTACPAFEPWASSLVADEPGSITSAAPSLVLAGTADAVVPPATVACVVDRLKARGTPVQACAYEGADHLSVVTSALPDVLRWMDARRAGTNLDVCPAPLVATCNAP